MHVHGMTHYATHLYIEYKEGNLDVISTGL